MPIVCYLCGKPVTKAAATADHVPARQFYAPAVRKTYNTTKLLTLRTHRACNEGGVERGDGKFRQLTASLEHPMPRGMRHERRNDDDLGVLQTRLQEFHTKTEPLGSFYKKLSILHRIDGNRDRDAVFADITRLIEDETAK